MPLATAKTAARTERNRRLNMLGGATVLGRDLADARARVNCAIAAHRKAQALAAKPFATFSRKPAATRLDVRKAVAGVRAVEARIEAKYGDMIPLAAPVAPSFLLAAE